MRRIRVLRCPSGAFAVSAVVLAVAACGRVPGQFEILNNQIPQPGCVIGVDETVYRGEGTVDLSIVRDDARAAYLVFPLMKNNLPAPAAGDIDNNSIVLSSFAVDISAIGAPPPQTAALFSALEAGADPNMPRALLHFQQPWSGSIASGGGLLSAAVAALPVDLARRIAATNEVGGAPSLVLNLRIRAFGKTTSQNMESDPFDYPVALCSGCLVGSVQTCPLTAKPANPGNACNAAQDETVDCCRDNGALVCPAPVVASQ